MYQLHIKVEPLKKDITFYLSAYSRFTTIDFTLGHKMNLDRFQNIEVVQTESVPKRQKNTVFIILLFGNSKLNSTL